MKAYLILFAALTLGTAAAMAEEFSKAVFSPVQCAGGLPVKKSKNPWLRIVKKNTVESYFVTPAVKDKAFAIQNLEDPIYSAPTTLERIDCKHGLIYFRRSVSEPITTTSHRVYDLMTGEEYAVTEGAVAMAPDERHLVRVSSTDRDQKCGRSESCVTRLTFFDCAGRTKKLTPCKELITTEYTLTGTDHHHVEFPVLPLKWNWNKTKKTLKLDIGGFKKMQARIKCSILPKHKCTVDVPKHYQVSIKNER